MIPPRPNPVVRGRVARRRCVLFAAAVAVVLSGARAGLAGGARFGRDVEALSRFAHRLAGSDEAAAAADHLRARLEAIGVDAVFEIDTPAWGMRGERVEMRIEDRVVPLSPLRPNLVAAPATPPRGLTGPLVYVGRGEPADYGSRRVEGGIVVIDYDCGDRWLRAFALGARAVVFLGDGEATPAAAKHVAVPLNLPRYFADRRELGGVDLERDHESATLYARTPWRTGPARSLVAVIRGRQPGFASSTGEPEAVVLATGYDTMGVVPERSPGARRAANAAAVLGLAERLVTERPLRDVVIMLLGAERRGHQGAREVYDAWRMPEAEHERLVWSHSDEGRWLEAAIEALSTGGGLPGRGFHARVGNDGGVRAALDAAAEQADFARADLQRELAQLRLDAIRPLQREIEDAPQREGRTADALHSRLRSLLEREQGLRNESLRWDEVRRHLHNRTLRGYVARLHAAARSDAAPPSDEDAITPDEARGALEVLAQLQTRTLERLTTRRGELRGAIRRDRQRTAVRQALAPGGEPMRIALHIDLELSDGGAAWSVVVGDDTDRVFRGVRMPAKTADLPEAYARILSILRGIAGRVDGLDELDATVLRDPLSGRSFAAGDFFVAGDIAGRYQIPHVTVMTGYDVRPRDGHPADTFTALDWRAVRGQATEAAALIAEAIDEAALSSPPRFAASALSDYPSWSRGRASGGFAGLQVTGGLSEDRPAAGALLAVWPAAASTGKAVDWRPLDDAAPRSFDPFVFERVQSNGRFRLIGLDDRTYAWASLLVTRTDDAGRVTAVSTLDTLTRETSGAVRVNALQGRGYGVVTLPMQEPHPTRFAVLRALADSAFRPNRTLRGQGGSVAFFYLSDRAGGGAVKLFQPLGPVALNVDAADAGRGSGFPLERFAEPRWMARTTATDLWRLNEGRLGQLRRQGVSSADLELMHARAAATLDAADVADSVNAEHALLLRAAAIARRVYVPLRSAMDDLVQSVVLLLILAIPFAFAVERLLVCATSVYGRIGGFAGVFAITFVLLYLMHPGFSIAAAPMIIILAFAIVLLSSLVIWIVVRKFESELGELQGQSSKVHDRQVSATGTLVAAMNMGMSTMRRRPTRTVLTAVTVVMLTFTILCFASFSRTIGVGGSFLGPADPAVRASLLVRQLDYGAMPEGLIDAVRGFAPEGGRLATHRWLVRETADDPAFAVARADDGRSVRVRGVLGVDGEELLQWPALASALAGDDAAGEALRDALVGGGVLVPRIVRDRLDLAVGDAVSVAGRRGVVAGVFDAGALRSLRHLDGKPVLPADFAAASAQGAAIGGGERAQPDVLVTDDTEKDFVYLTPEQIVVASSGFVGELGGEVRTAALYGPGGEMDGAPARGARLAEVVPTPVWSRGPEGVERQVLTVLTEVSGGVELAVPLLLGGLIIFGTLLGSISDREREIYTFSALGLSPKHVGVLFFAEAGVYAVIGGVGGQLLAQAVGLGAARLSAAGVLPPVSINFSSTNALFAIGVVMLTVLVSAIYPAVRASRSANPGLVRAWKLPPAEGDAIDLTFPFTVSAYDFTGVVSFLEEHFARHDDAGLGGFATERVRIVRDRDGRLGLDAEVALSPFDLGITQRLALTGVPSPIPGVDEVKVAVRRLSGAHGDWERANKVMMRDLRRQFLLWRTLGGDAVEDYRMRTLRRLGSTASRDGHRAPGGAAPPAAADPGVTLA